MLAILKKVKKLFISFLAILVFSLANCHISAQTFSYGELEAAYLYNFIKYTKCPGNVSILTISVFGETENMDELKKFFKGKKNAGSNIELKIINTEEEAIRCQIIYLPASASSKLPSLLKVTSGKNVLIVTEDDLAKKGATISFFIDDERLKFKINKTALLKSGIEASEGLLKLGVIL